LRGYPRKKVYRFNPLRDSHSASPNRDLRKVNSTLKAPGVKAPEFRGAKLQVKPRLSADRQEAV
jgi:hypothetical protein